MTQNNQGYTEEELDELLKPELSSRITNFVGKGIILLAIIFLTTIGSWCIFTLFGSGIKAMSYCIIFISVSTQLTCIYLLNKENTKAQITNLYVSITISTFLFAIFFIFGQGALNESVLEHIKSTKSALYYIIDHHIVGPAIVAAYFAHFPYLIAHTIMALYDSIIMPIIYKFILSKYKKLKPEQFSNLKILTHEKYTLDSTVNEATVIGFICLIVYFILINIYREEFIDFIPYILIGSLILTISLSTIELACDIYYRAKIKTFFRSHKSQISTLSLYETGLLRIILATKPIGIERLKVTHPNKWSEWIYTNEKIIALDREIQELQLLIPDNRSKKKKNETKEEKEQREKEIKKKKEYDKIIDNFTKLINNKDANDEYILHVAKETKLQLIEKLKSDGVRLEDYNDTE